jgi:hypothetical protein
MTAGSWSFCAFKKSSACAKPFSSPVLFVPRSAGILLAGWLAVTKKENQVGLIGATRWARRLSRQGGRRLAGA